jgi:2-dehydro-3-deoxyphosphogluconate aldolase/(4S)-4-hydroxy-2-oxoglutarate aldolase
MSISLTPEQEAATARRLAAVSEALRAAMVIPVVELDDPECIVPLFDALTAAGLPVVEITLRTPAGITAIARLRERHPDALIGAGTVLSSEDVERVSDAGADFVVSPATDAGVIQLSLSLGMLALPGTCTPTDVDTARRAGARLIKFFPAEAMGGVKMIKALAGPYKDVSFVPTGGISAANLGEYLAMPQVAACGGSWMVAPSLIAAGDYATIERLAAEAVAIAKGVRGDG